MRRGVARAGFPLALLALASCSAPASTRADPFGSASERGSASRTISVYAQNENDEDVVIYVMSVDGIERLGTVAPERTEAFRVRWTSSQELRVRVEILAGPRYTTNALNNVAPGDRVEVWVPRQVERSFIRRR